MTTIVMGSDHAGFEMKNVIKEHLAEKGFNIYDVGCDSTESVDYPIYGKKAGEAVMDGYGELGIVVFGSGIGISIAANKVHGIRCALCYTVDAAHMAKEHNNANMISIGGRVTSPELAMEIVDEWLNTEFAGGRHQRRVEMLDEM